MTPAFQAPDDSLKDGERVQIEMRDRSSLALAAVIAEYRDVVGKIGAEVVPGVISSLGQPPVPIEGARREGRTRPGFAPAGPRRAR